MFLVKVPTQKAKFKKNLYINQISQTNFESFSNQRSDTALILSPLNFSLQSFFYLHLFLFTRHIFLLLAFCSRHIWLDIQARDVHLKALRGHSNIKALGEHSEGTRALGHSGTWRALGHSKGTWALRGHLGTRARKALGHSDT